MTSEDPSKIDRDPAQSLSAIYHALRAARRRHVIELLFDTENEPVSVRTLARQITAHEQDIPVDRATGDPYRSVYNSLSQTHLPTLADAGLINYDSDRQTVTTGPDHQIGLLLVILNRAAYQSIADLLRSKGLSLSSMSIGD